MTLTYAQNCSHCEKCSNKKFSILLTPAWVLSTKHAELYYSLTETRQAFENLNQSFIF